jgi:NADPH:quinone reductase-like Zn-dependent oxidoreductase
VAFFGVRRAWSEYVTAPVRLLPALPDTVSDDSGSLVMLNPLRMLQLLRAVTDVWAGDSRPLLQTAAGSSVGRLVSAVAAERGYPLVNAVGGELARELVELLEDGGTLIRYGTLGGPV